MGVERAVTRWYVRRQMLLQEIETLERRLHDPPPVGQARQTTQTGQAELQRQLSVAQERLRALGSCPKPMMG